MRILITGGSGLFGEKIAEKAIERGHKVYSCYNRNTPTNGTPLKMNLEDNKKTTESIHSCSPDLIIHSGAVTNVDYCEKNQALAWKINVESTKTIAEYGKYRRTPIIFVSTDYVFSGENGNYQETDAPQPKNYYGLTKLAGEQIIRGSLLNTIIRPSVIFGVPNKSHRQDFAHWIIQSLNEKKTISVVTDQIVSPTMTTNLAEITLNIINEKKTGLFHTAGATQISRYDFALQLAERFDFDQRLIKKSKLSQINWYATRPKNTSLNVSKITSEIKIHPWKINSAIDHFAKEMEESI